MGSVGLPTGASMYQRCLQMCFVPIEPPLHLILRRRRGAQQPSKERALNQKKVFLCGLRCMP